MIMPDEAICGSMARMPALLLASVLWYSALVVAHPTSIVLQQRSFDANGHSCNVKVMAREIPVTREPNERIWVRCDGATILTHDLGDAGVHNIVLYDDDTTAPTRIEVNWERGTGAGLTIIEVHHTPIRAVASIAFEHFSKHGAESFENSDILLAHVGNRFLASEMIPEGTNIYRWKEGKYSFECGFRWRSDARWKDRYCILLNVQTCPADQTTTPVPDN